MPIEELASNLDMEASLEANARALVQEYTKDELTLTLNNLLLFGCKYGIERGMVWTGFAQATLQRAIIIIAAREILEKNRVLLDSVVEDGL